MKKLTYLVIAVALGLCLAAPLPAADAKSAPEARTLFTNVNVFDGANEQLIENANVLVEGNLIKQVSTSTISAPGATVIDGGGRTLMPGLIDSHVHLTITMSLDRLMSEPADYVAAATLQEAEATLMRGYTTVRDASGRSSASRRPSTRGDTLGLGSMRPVRPWA